MPYVRLSNGVVAHIKMAKSRRRRCVGTEGGHPCPVAATRQCDHPVGTGKTCNAWICSSHAIVVGPNIDHCPDHVASQRGLFTGLVDQKGAP